VLRLVVALALLLPASASAKFVFFQTPSHNIGCAFSSSPASLRCDIRTGLKPSPPKPNGSHTKVFYLQIAHFRTVLQEPKRSRLSFLSRRHSYRF